MFKYAEQFIDYLSGMNAKFEVQLGVDENGNEAVARVQIPYGGTKITASFFGDEKGSNFSANMAIGAIIPEFIKLVREDVIALCNEFNNKNQWVKFCVRDSSSVPGLNGALICLEESAMLVEKTAAQDAYSIVSNLIKAFSESAESFKKILNRSPAEKEKAKANNRPVNISEKPKETPQKTDEKSNNNQNMWLPVILAGVGAVVGFLFSGLLGFVLGVSGFSLMIKQKKEGPYNLILAVLTVILFVADVAFWVMATNA